MVKALEKLIFKSEKGNQKDVGVKELAFTKIKNTASYNKNTGQLKSIMGLSNLMDEYL